MSQPSKGYAEANKWNSIQSAVGISGFIAESNMVPSEAIAGLMIVLLAAVRPDLGMEPRYVGPFIQDLTTSIVNWVPPAVDPDFIPEVPGGISNAN